MTAKRKIIEKGTKETKPVITTNLIDFDFIESTSAVGKRCTPQKTESRRKKERIESYFVLLHC
jgi:hypothetical protein